MSEVNEIAKALAKAQSEMSHAKMDGVNPHFKSKYATLAAVQDACKSALNKNGIAYLQYSHDCDNGVKIETIFYHESGQQLSAGIVFVPADKFNAHGLGSAMTYAKRYSLATACGISADDDDDGNQAVANAPKKPGRGKITPMEAALEDANVDWEAVSEYVPLLQAGVFNEDDVGLQQLMDELADDDDLKMGVWHKLNSKERAYIRKLKDKAA